MVEAHLLRLTSELKLSLASIRATAQLLEEGGTVPFIARYRKEATGSLDEVQITAVRDRLAQMGELDARRSAIEQSLAERSLLSDALKAELAAAETLARLEDIYQPFRPKRRTRAMIAEERGLRPLADFILEQPDADPAAEAVKFVDAAKEVADVAAALAGARDIIAERISDHADTRTEVREVFEKHGILKSEVVPTKEAEGAKFKDYFAWSEPLAKAPSHRVLAIRRGSQEGFLFFSVNPPDEAVLPVLERRWVRGAGPGAQVVREAVQDGYKRLLGPSMETEVRVSIKKRADAEAIKVFADNLRDLLLASPLGQKRVLALDPGFRTGCKLVCLDAQGNLVHDDVIYPSQGDRKIEEARQKLLAYAARFQIEAIAIGNGTASRETEHFVRSVGLPASITVVMVNESGASIYSASDVAREEFPDKDLTIRGAVSIGRRLMDPLAELVKLDPKSIGVGQYQHDVDQRKLKESLDDTVVSCVNGVGVEVNTASKQLLSYVSGLNARTAGSIVEYRRSAGAFRTRRQLLDVAGLGPKAFEQAAGFLRIRGGEHPLDGSAVHPERYALVERMAADLGCGVADLMRDPAKRQKIKLESYVSDTVGLPTLQDIVNELAKPGRDPREQFEAFSFAEGVNTVEDLRVGMKLPGIITNVAAFGAFCDLGVHQDGLIHISQLADKFVQNPAEVVKVQQRVQVTVVEIDLARKRIGLSLKSKPDFPGQTKTERAPGAPAERHGPRGPRPPQGGNVGGPQGGNRGPRRETNLGGNWFDDALGKGKR